MMKQMGLDVDKFGSIDTKNFDITGKRIENDKEENKKLKKMLEEEILKKEKEEEEKKRLQEEIKKMKESDEKRKKEECKLRHRDSILKDKKYLIFEATFELKKGDQIKI